MIRQLMTAALLSITVSTAHAGIFDSITTIIGGHVDDLTSRLSADEYVGGKSIRFGTIRDDDPGQDFLHRASGTVSIVEKDGKFYVQLGADFESTPGPDYHVYVSTSANIIDESAFNSTKQIELGRLIKGSGASYYELSGISADEVRSVTIWCKAFGEFIGSANV